MGPRTAGFQRPGTMELAWSKTYWQRCGGGGGGAKLIGNVGDGGG